jgi:cytochrome c peroxidase
LYARKVEEVEKMKRLFLAVPLGVFLFVGCVVGPGYRGSGVVVVPALPTVVVLEEEPYYFHAGYHYHYRDNRWFYSNARSGPWVELPRDRYPKEVRHKGRGDERGRGEKRGHDKDHRY